MTAREDLVQTLIEHMMSLRRIVRHPVPPPGEPPLSPPQANLLFTIAHHPRGLSVKELAEFTGVTPGAITQFVDTLVQKGLVAREGDLDDRRVVRLKVTKLAIDQFERFRREHLSSFTKLFEVLSDEEIEQLNRLFAKIASTQNGKEKYHVEPDQTP